MRLSDATGVYIGSTPVSKLYVGMQEVWGSGPSANNVFAINGDSRFQQAGDANRPYLSTSPTDVYTNARTYRATGFIPSMHNASGNVVRIPLGCNFAIGGETSAQIAARAPQDAQQAADYGCENLIFLGGVNDSSLTVQQSIDAYTTIFNEFSSRGIRLFVCNELPKDGDEASPANHLARKAWLEDPARLSTWPSMVQIDTFSTCHDPATNCSYKAGYSYDGLHPNYKGHKEFGIAIGNAIANKYPLASYPSLLSLPTTDTLSSYINQTTALFTGTSGSVGTATGTLASNWSFTKSSACSFVLSKGTNSNGYDEQIITVSGTDPTTSFGRCEIGHNIPSSQSYSAGTRLRISARIKLDANPQNIIGVWVGGLWQGSNVTPAGGFARVETGTLTPTSSGDNDNWLIDSDGFEYDVVPQEIVLPPNWNSGTGTAIQIFIRLYHMGFSRTVSATARVSQFGVQVVTE